MERLHFLLSLSSNLPLVRSECLRGNLFTSELMSRGDREEIETLIYLSFLRIPRSMLSYLPPRFQFESVLQFYYQELEILDHCFHRPTLLSTLDSFWTTDPSNKGNETSELSFLALVFAILLGSACMLTKDRWHLIGVQNESLEEYDEILEKWNLAYLTLLAASDWIQQPNLYSLQSVITVRRAIWRRSRFAFSFSLNTLALRAAEFIGFGMLGSASELLDCRFAFISM